MAVHNVMIRFSEVKENATTMWHMLPLYSLLVILQNFPLANIHFQIKEVSALRQALHLERRDLCYAAGIQRYRRSSFTAARSSS